LPIREDAEWTFTWNYCCLQESSFVRWRSFIVMLLVQMYVLFYNDSALCTGDASFDTFCQCL